MMLFAENLGDRYSKSTPAKPCETRKLSSWAWMYLKVCCILGLVAALYQLTLYGFRLSSLTSISALAKINNTIAVARYSGKGIVSGVTQILLIFVYAAPACGGFALVWSERFLQKIWSVVTMLPPHSNGAFYKYEGSRDWGCDYLGQGIFSGLHCKI